MAFAGDTKVPSGQALYYAAPAVRSSFGSRAAAPSAASAAAAAAAAPASMTRRRLGGPEPAAGDEPSRPTKQARLVPPSPPVAVAVVPPAGRPPSIRPSLQVLTGRDTRALINAYAGVGECPEATGGGPRCARAFRYVRTDSAGVKWRLDCTHTCVELCPKWLHMWFQDMPKFAQFNGEGVYPVSFHLGYPYDRRRIVPETRLRSGDAMWLQNAMSLDRALAEMCELLQKGSNVFIHAIVDLRLAPKKDRTRPGTITFLNAKRQPMDFLIRGVTPGFHNDPGWLFWALRDRGTKAEAEFKIQLPGGEWKYGAGPEREVRIMPPAPLPPPATAPAALAAPFNGGAHGRPAPRHPPSARGPLGRAGPAGSAIHPASRGPWWYR